jgi:hypothetical protein
LHVSRSSSPGKLASPALTLQLSFCSRMSANWVSENGETIARGTLNVGE